MEFNPDHEAEEIDNWNKERNYADIRYVTIAVASHLQLSGQLSVPVRQVEEWVPRDIADIIDEFGDELYTSPVPGQTREQIRPEDLEYLPLLDEDDREIPLFTHNGYQIEHRLTDMRMDTWNRAPSRRHANGYLEYLPLLDEDDREIPLFTHNGYQIERHLAAHSEGDKPHGVLMNLRHLNILFDEDGIEEDLELLDDDMEATTLPHETFDCKIANDDIDRDLQLENVYAIDVLALPEAGRNGEYLLTRVLQPLTFTWGHSSILQQIKENVVLFTAQAYPVLYSWTMAMEALLSDYGLQEGNVAVIAMTIMNPLWIGQGIIQDGIPCYNPEMVTINGSCMIRVDRDMWPYNPKTHQPRTSARTSQLYVYNKTVAKAFYAWLSMGLAPWRWVPPIAQHPNLVCSRAHGIMYSALSMFIEDCTGLVSSKVKTSIKRQLADLEPRIHQVGNSRTWDLALWEHTADPLAWGTDSSHAMQTFALLINILSNDPEVPMNMRQASKHIGYKELALQIVRMLRDEELTPVGAPVRAKGGFLPAMKLAYLMIRQMIKPDVVEKDKVEDYIAVCMSSMMQKMRIQMVPWHKENPMGAMQACAIDHRWWMMMRWKPDDDGLGPRP
ncbi:hypothetical protein L208DRAFT_1382346 [Tricholoma matsutake]|nr:hypothetical protein L208DRAFT_1382346 [Tricholoma matsutake 945]